MPLEFIALPQASFDMAELQFFTLKLKVTVRAQFDQNAAFKHYLPQPGCPAVFAWREDSTKAIMNPHLQL